MNTDQTITNILHAASKTDDPQALREYARDLERWGDWENAKRLEDRAVAVERKQAEDL
jgi:hypothetical protein